jgi:hypothetical protein
MSTVRRPSAGVKRVGSVGTFAKRVIREQLKERHLRE